ncbi:type I-E CRISPR-associated protein Cse1/CasA [Escherichia coli]
MLGLLQTSFTPKDHRRWDDIWEDGLEAEKLREALQSLEHAFQFRAKIPLHLCRISRRSPRR